jgi:hypothetical protein
MPRARAFLCLALAAISAAALAHHAPNSYVRFDFEPREVRAEFMVPESELAFALPGPSPDTLPAYLLQHVGARTPQGAAWTVAVGAVRETTYLDQPYLVAELRLLPPPGGSARDFILTNDAITHEVRNHVVVVVGMRDYADAGLAAAPEFLGALQYPARQLPIRRPASGPDRRPADAPGR